ncbi:MAG: MFS transporter [Candidatus Hodarchaeota archaeon]
MDISSKSPMYQNDKANTKYLRGTYRTWPIFIVSFIRLFYVSIFERALFNYLYFVIDIRASTLGFISSAGALTYIVAPIIGQLLTKKFLGIRNAIILSSMLTPFLTIAQILYPVAWFLIICRVLLGLTLGFFWPNCLNLLSKWQKVSSVEKSKKNFAMFNLSWNSGFIIGLLVGFLWAFSMNDYSAMIISWLLSFLLIPLSFFIQKEEKHAVLKELVIYQSEDPLSHLDIKEDLIVNSKTPMIVYSVLFSWISIMFLTISKSIFVFGYPILVKALLSDRYSYLTYLVQCGIQFMQLLGLTWINSMKIYSRKISTLISFIVVALIAFTIVLLGDIWYISIITAIAGLFLGLIHGVGLKIMLEYGTAENSTRYSTINEIIVGMGFGLTPIIAGYVVEIEIYSIHYFLIFLGLVVFFILLYLSRNVKKEKIS